jgi:hypothetical protein
LITNIHAQQNLAISFIQNNKTIKISAFKEVISLDKKPFSFRFFSFARLMIQNKIIFYATQIAVLDNDVVFNQVK